MKEYFKSPTSHLSVAVDKLSIYIDSFIAPVLLSQILGSSAVIKTTEGGINLSVGFTDKLINHQRITIPTVFNIQMGDRVSQGHGGKIIHTWEESFPEAEYFGADSVTNPIFWSKMGYMLYEPGFWIKK